MQNWRFVQDDRLTEEAVRASQGADWEEVELPHTWNANAASLNVTEPYKRGIGWYRLEFPTPAAGACHCWSSAPPASWPTSG